MGRELFGWYLVRRMRVIRIAAGVLTSAFLCGTMLVLYHSYGQIALLCQMPNHARQVGYALSHHRWSREIPAHRIVSGARALTGAKAFETPATQRVQQALSAQKEL